MVSGRQLVLNLRTEREIGPLYELERKFGLICRNVSEVLIKPGTKLKGKLACLSL